jgi:hypothetical protein
MINLQLNIRNPWSNRFQNIKCWHGRTPIKNKYWELQIYKSSDVLDLNINITHRQSHAGIRIGFGILGFNTEFQIYDNRHWSDKLQSWEFY